MILSHQFGLKSSNLTSYQLRRNTKIIIKKIFNVQAYEKKQLQMLITNILYYFL